jgi:hypothetical protein
MTAVVELDETRMCNLLGNEPLNFHETRAIIRGRNQQRRIAGTPQAFSGAISIVTSGLAVPAAKQTTLLAAVSSRALRDRVAMSLASTMP